jgi:hypothetical protein
VLPAPMTSRMVEPVVAFHRSVCAAVAVPAVPCAARASTVNPEAPVPTVTEGFAEVPRALFVAAIGVACATLVSVTAPMTTSSTERLKVAVMVFGPAAGATRYQICDLNDPVPAVPA